MKKMVFCLSVLMIFCGFAAAGYALETESLGGVEIHGFISQGYLKSNTYNYLANDSKKGSFQFNEIGVNFSKQVTDKLRIGIQLFSRDLGDAANNKVTVDWAYGDYRFRDWLGLRAGKIKIPFGLYGDIRDIDMLRPCIILPQSLYPELARDSMIAANGAALYGTIPMSAAGSLEYHAQVGIINEDADSGLSKIVTNKFAGVNLTDYNSDNYYIGTLRWNTPLTGLALKATYMKGAGDMPLSYGSLSFSMSMKNEFQVYSAEYFWKGLTLSGEYMINNTDYSAMGTSGSMKSEGYYGMGSYRFADWVEAGVYYSIYYPDTKDKHGESYIASGGHDYYAWDKDAALFVRFDVNNHFIIKLEGHYVDGTTSIMTVDNPTRDDKNWWYFAAKATFSF